MLYITCYYAFLARLHFSAEELLLYPRRRRQRPCRRPQNVRENVKSLGILVFMYFFLHFNFAYHTNKAPFNSRLRQARIR